MACTADCSSGALMLPRTYSTWRRSATVASVSRSVSVRWAVLLRAVAIVHSLLWMELSRRNSWENTSRHSRPPTMRGKWPGSMRLSTVAFGYRIASRNISRWLSKSAPKTACSGLEPLTRRSPRMMNGRMASVYIPMALSRASLLGRGTVVVTSLRPPVGFHSHCSRGQAMQMVRFRTDFPNCSNTLMINVSARLSEIS